MKNFFSVVMLFAAAGTACVRMAAEPKSLYDIQCAAFNPEKAKSIHSAKLVYEVKDGSRYSCLVIRATSKNQSRIDFLEKKAIFSVCRNGEKYWAYDSAKGFIAPTRSECEGILIDLAFLPLPFGEKADLFQPLTPEGQGTFGKAARQCRVYGTTLIHSPKEKFELWADAGKHLLYLVRASCEDGPYATRFFNYRDFDGIRMATRITLAAPEGSVRMKLLSADWNVALPETVFSQSSPVDDNALVLLQKNIAGKTDDKPAAAPSGEITGPLAGEENRARTVRHNAAVRERLKWQIRKQEKIVRDLEIRIAAKEKTLQNAGSPGGQERYSDGSVRRAWNFYGWQNRSSGGRKTMRAAKSYFTNTKSSNSDFERRSLTNMQIQLGDARAELEILMEKMQALTAKENGAAGEGR